MIRLLNLSIIFLSALMLTGCHFIKKPAFLDKRNKEYLTATSIPPLKIPPGLSSSTFYNQYPVPYREYPPGTLCVSTVPPGL